MRELTSHKVDGVDDGLIVTVRDEPGSGGACYNYRIEHANPPGKAVDLHFQNGPTKEVGVNGLTHETLLAILIDRLEGFQSGQYACAENGSALQNLKSAQYTLKSRTEQRKARGVEGTMVA